MVEKTRAIFPVRTRTLRSGHRRDYLAVFDNSGARAADGLARAERSRVAEFEQVLYALEAEETPV